MNRSATLDGIRGILATIVMSDHLTEAEGLNHIINRGYLSVDFFFLLSGYVLSKSYRSKSDSYISGVSSFFISRFNRLYPMIFFGTLLGVLASIGQVVISDSISLQSVLSAAFFGLILLPVVPYTDGSGGIGFPLNGVVWSLFYQISSNMIWICLLPFLTRRVGAIILVGCLVWICVIAAMHGNLHHGADFRFLFEGSGRAAFAFSAGVALAGIRIRARAMRGEYVVLLLLLALAVPDFPGDRFYDVICVAVLFPILLLLAVEAEPTTGAKVWIWAGAISYALYLIHIPILRVGHWVATKAALTGTALWVFVAAEGLVIILISYAVLKLYDEPVRAYLRKSRAPSGIRV